MQITQFTTASGSNLSLDFNPDTKTLTLSKDGAEVFSTTLDNTKPPQEAVAEVTAAINTFLGSIFPTWDAQVLVLVDAISFFVDVQTVPQVR